MAGSVQALQQEIRRLEGELERALEELKTFRPLHAAVRKLELAGAEHQLELEASLLDRLMHRIRQDAELRELLRGPAGADGADGLPGGRGAGLDVPAVVQSIRQDPALQELLRGPRGHPGEDGAPGRDGDAGQTVIREVRISG